MTIHTAPERARIDPTGPDGDETPDTEPFDKDLWDKGVRWVLVALTLVCSFYVLQQHQGLETLLNPAPSSDPAPASGTSSDGSAEGTSTETAADVQQATAPRVPDIVRADFAKGAPWPVGAGSRETAAVSWPLGVVDNRFVHGPPDGPDAISWLERWLRSDVRKLGVRIQFPARHSGAVAITAWRTSVLDANGTALPRTGMRLVATPGHWRLVVIDRRGSSTLASGTYAKAGRSASFEMVRKGERLWVVDPAGVVTPVSDPRIASLAGPWASWELRESEPHMNPAALEEIWAG